MINVAGIVNESIVDGLGIRFVIFEQGCTHNCLGCHNPETHSFDIMNLYSNEDILNIIKSNPLLDGVTFSGGDPFFQAKENIPLIKEIKELGLNVWAYTGFTWEEFMSFKSSGTHNYMIEMLELCDVLVDGRFIQELKVLDKDFVGSSNQRTIDVQKSLRSNEIILFESEEEL